MRFYQVVPSAFERKKEERRESGSCRVCFFLLREIAFTPATAILRSRYDRSQSRISTHLSAYGVASLQTHLALFRLMSHSYISTTLPIRRCVYIGHARREKRRARMLKRPQCSSDLSLFPNKLFVNANIASARLFSSLEKTPIVPVARCDVTKARIIVQISRQWLQCRAREL